MFRSSIPFDRAQFVLCFALLVLSAREVSAADPASVDFNRDIRPIFSEHCYACHGPDENKRKAGLRLDVQEGAFGELKSGERAVVAGDPAKSALVQRIVSPHPDDLMPPPEEGKPLNPEQIELLQRWIREGAVWQDHWSFIPPARPSLPQVTDSGWVRNPIDRFILARLEKEGLRPNPEADKATLLRRVTFDLTGLPPTIREVDAFLSDESADAYERVVDRLLQSPHYGERMAQHWLDLARYADTSGYHFDGVRFMWLWRDWVIKSFNDNQPYDAFTIEQLAGDLLPNPTQSQRLATGFVRNNMTNDEGGADPDEYLNKYVVDRVNTLGAVWMGMTVGCAECHDHKYDPLSTKEFYQLYAFFHNVPEKGLDRIRTDNPPPRLPVPTPEQALQFVEADFTLKDAEKTLQDRINELGETQEKWEHETNAKPPPPFPQNGLLAQLSFGGPLAAKSGVIVNTGRFVSTNVNAATEARFSNALVLDGKGHVEYDSIGAFGRTNTFSIGAWLKLQTKQGCILSKTDENEGKQGISFLLTDSRFELVFSDANGESIQVKTREQFPQNQWLYAVATYDGSGKAAGVQLFVNGKRREFDVVRDKLEGCFGTAAPLQVGSRRGQLHFIGSIDSVTFFDRVLPIDEIRLIEFHGYLPVIAKSRGKRTSEERADLARFYKENHARDYLQAEAALANARKVKQAFYTSIPTSMIMEEMNPPRETFILVRGNYREKGEKVSANTPGFLPPLPEGSADRLALARWLMSKGHPLTARVTVNRFWGVFFGNGLVKTMNDFGSQGEWPSHPELLDWLAVQFRDGGPVASAPEAGSSEMTNGSAWDVKALVRLIVTSATYRQAATVSPEKLERDPHNRLLTRGPRLRLDAEFIRDNALEIAGLLNRKIGGPSVKPYQPPGIWDGVDAKYQQDHGDALYRRGIYVFWRRSAHYPSFATFDAPNREVCTFLRQRTQTPLQSLVLLNDPAYVEAARALAQRVLEEAPGELQQQLWRAFRHTLGRVPESAELDLLRDTYTKMHARFQENPTAAEEFLSVGELKRPDGAEPAKLAALTAVANVLLNLNETISK